MIRRAALAGGALALLVGIPLLVSQASPLSVSSANAGVVHVAVAGEQIYIPPGIDATVYAGQTPPPEVSPSASSSVAPSENPTLSPTASPSSTAAPSQSPTPLPTPAPTPSPAPTPPASPPASPSSVPFPTPAPGFTTIQAAVNAAPAGSTISVPAGTYRETVSITKPIKLLAFGKVVLDGQNTRQFAFDIAANDVNLDGFEVANYRPPYQRGAINSHGVSRTTLRHINAHDNPGAGKGQDLGNNNTIGGGISFTGGSGHLLEDSTISGNETIGVDVNGDNTPGMITIRRVTISNNNPGGYNLANHSGGVKATQVDGLSVTDSIVSNNRGDGIWCDINCRHVTISGNRVDHNSFGGIHYEISDLATITGNTVWENGWARTDGWGWGAGIQVVESRRVTVSNNIVAWSNRGISFLVPNTGRGTSFPVSKPGSYDGLVASGNTVVSSDGYLLFWGDGVGKGMFAGAKDATASYWSATPPAVSQGATPVVNMTPAQRDAALTAAGIPLGRS